MNQKVFALILYFTRKSKCFYHFVDLVNLFFLTITDSSVRNKETRLLLLKNKFKGKRCFIMGNGPSLNKMNLDVFSNEYVWGTNRCYLLFDRIPWRPTFYVAVDTRVVPDIANDINSIIKTLNETYFFFPIQFRKKRLIKSADNVFWYDELKSTELEEIYSVTKYFSNDVSKGLAPVNTVTIAAIQLSVFLGFNPIFLFGCDTSYKIPSTVQIENEDPQLLISTLDDDENHFDPQYFGKNSKWHDPHPDLMINNYKEVKKVLDQSGLQVINATVGGNLEVFPRINYQLLFSMENLNNNNNFHNK